MLLLGGQRGLPLSHALIYGGREAIGTVKIQTVAHGPEADVRH